MVICHLRWHALLCHVQGRLRRGDREGTWQPLSPLAATQGQLGDEAAATQGQLGDEVAGRCEVVAAAVPPAALSAAVPLAATQGQLQLGEIAVPGATQRQATAAQWQVGAATAEQEDDVAMEGQLAAARQDDLDEVAVPLVAAAAAQAELDGMPTQAQGPLDEIAVPLATTQGQLAREFDEVAVPLGVAESEEDQLEPRFAAEHGDPGRVHDECDVTEEKLSAPTAGARADDDVPNRTELEDEAPIEASVRDDDIREELESEGIAVHGDDDSHGYHPLDKAAWTPDLLRPASHVPAAAAQLPAVPPQQAPMPHAGQQGQPPLPLQALPRLTGHTVWCSPVAAALPQPAHVAVSGERAQLGPLEERPAERFALAAPQGQVAVFLWQEARRFRGVGIGRQEACRWLADLCEQGQDRDLTHTGLAWRSYMACHKDGELVTGPGITHFLFVSFGDHADFVVRRTDLVDVRLHPASRRENPPVYGRLQDWLCPTQVCVAGSGGSPLPRRRARGASQAAPRQVDRVPQQRKDHPGCKSRPDMGRVRCRQARDSDERD